MVELPQTIGRYRIRGVIGTGGYATVYEAHDERLAATVAVKVLADNHCFDPDIRERFLQEGRILRRIASTHVVAVHDLGETERGQPYLVLDYADRGDLAERAMVLRGEGWTPTSADVLVVADSLADALRSIHARDIVHRDLAPRNILLRTSPVPTSTDSRAIASDERMVLTDLGLSKDLATASGLTAAGGTAGFTAPEQRDAPGRVDPRTDVWAATAVLVWLLLDEPPDNGGGWRDRVAAGGWPAGVVDALTAGLADEPGDRPATADDWLASLRTVLAPPLTPPSPPKPVKRRPVWLVALGAVLLVVVGGAVGVLTSGDGDESGEPERVVEQLDDGRSRVEAEDDGRVVAIVGPTEAQAGEPVIFEAATEGIEEAMWIAPDGQLHPDSSQLEVTGSSAGRATVRLLGTDDRGRVLQAALEFQVIDDG